MIYWILRVSAVILGLLMISSSLSSLVFPDIIHSEAPYRLAWQQIILDIAFLIYGLLLLVPHRWFIRNPLFIGKLLLLGIGVLWFFYVAVTSFLEFSQGRKHWLIVPVSIAMILLGLIAPLSLVLKKRMSGA